MLLFKISKWSHKCVQSTINNQQSTINNQQSTINNQQSTINNYIISLNSALSRRIHIEKEFSQKGISFEFFDAISLDNPSNKVPKYWLSHLENAKLTQGEKGCLLSHILLWEKCINKDLPYICIFEDDIILSTESKLFLKDLTWIEQNFNLCSSFVIRLETFLMPIEQEKIPYLSSYQGRTLNKLNSVHYGTAGYIISNQAAKYLLEYIKRLPEDKLLAIDQIMFNQVLSDKNLLIYQLDPAICIQELQLNKGKSKLGSQLEEKRQEAYLASKPKRSLWQKLLREIYRIKRRKQERTLNSGKNYKIVEFL